MPVYGESAEETLEYFKYSACISILFGIPPIIVKAFGSLTRYVLDINSLMTLAVIGACIIGEYVEGAAVCFLFSLSEWLETRATEKARNAIAAVMSLRPDRAELVGGEAVEVESVQIGTRLQVRPGEKVPIDSKVVHGSTSLDCQSLTD